MKINMYERFILTILAFIVERSWGGNQLSIVLTVIHRGKVLENDVKNFRYYNQWLEGGGEE